MIEGLTDPVIQKEITSRFTPETAWQQLRMAQPGLYEFMTFNYSGF
jgi:hypothetical protein